MVKNNKSFAINVDNIKKTYGYGANSFQALCGVSLNIYDGEFFTLLGPSGCGKTTLLRIIAGFDYPTSGGVSLHNMNIVDLPPYKRPVNTVFQSYALFPHMTVAQNIGFGLKMQGKSKDEIKQQVDKMLDLVQMKSLANRQTGAISGGQQQRVALARALAPHPKVLLLDEPLSALDYKLRKDMQVELKELQKNTGITFIFVTHDQEEALTMSDRIAVMNKGDVLQVGEPKEIYRSPINRFVADFIGETNFINAEIISRDGDLAQVKIAEDTIITAVANDDTRMEGSLVTLALRPEHISLSKSLDGLTATIENVVYLGTDTHFYLKLSNGQKLISRMQNSFTLDELKQGDVVSLKITHSAAQILKD